MKWRHYLRCDECGVDAGKACRDDNDREALEVCDGRVLKVPGDVRPQSQRNVPSRRDAVVPDAVRKSRGHRSHVVAPTMVPCDYCGTPTRLWGAAHIAGKTWCAAPACQTVKKRAKWARERASAKERANVVVRPAKTRPCVICSAPVSAHGVGTSSEAACPGACREARWRQRLDTENGRRRDRRAASPASTACHWCATVLPGQSRRPGERACCGGVTCVRARATEDRRARRHKHPRPEVACTWCGVAMLAIHRAHGRPCCGSDLCQRARVREKSRIRRCKAAMQESVGSA